MTPSTGAKGYPSYTPSSSVGPPSRLPAALRQGCGARSERLRDQRGSWPHVSILEPKQIPSANRPADCVDPSIFSCRFDVGSGQPLGSMQVGTPGSARRATVVGDRARPPPVGGFIPLSAGTAPISLEAF